MSTQQYNHIFNRHWVIYQKILQNDYMGHQRIFGVLKDALHSSQNDVELELLDIGSGDAQTLTRHLSDFSVANYTAIDLSKDALEIARENIQKISTNFICHNSDFTKAISSMIAKQKRYNVIFSGFALHHVKDDQKAQLFADILRLLKPGGVFYYIDVCMREGEQRDIYLDRYLAPSTTTWNALDAIETEILHEHVRSSDFPSTQSAIQKMGEDAGYRDVDCLLYDDDHANVLFAMKV